MLEPDQIVLLGEPSDKGGRIVAGQPVTPEITLIESRIYRVYAPVPFHVAVYSVDPTNLVHWPRLPLRLSSCATISIGIRMHRTKRPRADH